MQPITRNRRREVCRSWHALTAALATVLVASVAAASAVAATGPPQNTTRPTITYTDQWQRGDAAGAGCHAISDATNQTYSPTSLDVGNTLRVVVTATNSSGSGASISHQSAVIRSGSSVQVSLNASATVVGY